MESARENGWSGWVGWLKGLEARLDDYGRPAWLATMVVGFIVLWPIGLAILGYMLWSGRMGCWRKGERSRRWGARRESSGNTAFDAYRDETLRRLEEEREAFSTFLQRLRDAKDKAEFDQFMAERRRDEGGAVST